MLNNLNKKHIKNSIFVSAVITGLIIILFLIQQLFPDYYCEGVIPGKYSQWYRILIYPFFHASISHLLSNMPPLFILLAGMYYYFPKQFFISFFTIWLGSGIIILVFARSGCHLGASGIIYGYTALLALLGFIKKQNNLGAFVLIMLFLYGGMIWGVIPQNGNISWEGHAGGAFIGIILAIIWHKVKTFDEQNNEDENNTDTTSKYELVYHYKQKNTKP